MPQRLAILPLLLLLLPTPGCIYDLDVEGKQCNSEHICPSGYECVEWEGENICKPKKDGGSNGGDGCFGTDTECVSYEQIRSCSAEIWVIQDCPDGEYCTDFAGQAKAACVTECTSHEDCQSHEDFYCDENSHCEPKGTCTEKPDENRCSPDGSRVIKCNSETGIDEEIQICEIDQYCDRTKAQCRDFCDYDTDCDPWPQESCNQATGRCEAVFSCQEAPDNCNTVLEPSWIATRCENDDCDCTGSVCVVRPTEQCAADVLDLSCFLGTPSDPGNTPTTCNLDGLVALFENLIPISYNADVEVQAHELANILNGDTASPLKSAQVTDDAGQSKYLLAGLPTNRDLVLEVRCQDGTTDCGLHNMYTFGTYLRADECSSGTISFSAPAIPNSLWPTYATAGQHTITADPNKGIFLGRLRECSVATNAIEKGVGDVSMSREVVYYIPLTPPINIEDRSTSTKGFFGAANVLPVRGLASALVRDQGDLLSLRTYQIRIFKNSASLVFFDKPKKPW